MFISVPSTARLQTHVENMDAIALDSYSHQLAVCGGNVGMDVSCARRRVC